MQCWRASHQQVGSPPDPYTVLLAAVDGPQDQVWLPQMVNSIASSSLDMCSCIAAVLTNHSSWNTISYKHQNVHT